MRRLALAGIAAMLACLAACSGDGNRVSTEPTSASSIGSSGEPRSDAPPSGVPADLQGRIEESKALAVRDHGIDIDELEVAGAAAVEWPNSGYGCPLTEETYEPGPFPGYRIVLRHGTRTYLYTSGEQTELKECLGLE